MNQHFNVDDRVLVKSQSIAGGKVFGANITGHHVSGYYIQPEFGVEKSEQPLYVTYDEVMAIDSPPKPRFSPGSVVRLGSPDGPEVLVLAVFSRGVLIEVHSKTASHITEVPASDLFEPVMAERRAVVV